jgi:Asp-tRNA(Asn)/Glu-tRNA(Gln) amidotransferase A subunit family amidase
MTDLARMIATKAISPVEVVRAHLERISAIDRDLRS